MRKLIVIKDINLVTIMKLKSIFFIAMASTAFWYVAFAQSNAQPSAQAELQTNQLAQKTEQATQLLSHAIDKAMPTAIVNIGIQETEPEPPLVTSARKQIGVTTKYDPAYVALKFPMGDVPKDRGVCTDVVVRAYRQQGRDLQALVNADMKKAWAQYPKIWGLKSTDKNIDHRRVPNLRVFFTRHGKSLPITNNPADYKAGDLVTWDVSGRPHIGIVSNRTKNGTPLIIHNIGAGTQENDVLFRFNITGHYRY